MGKTNSQDRVLAVLELFSETRPLWTPDELMRELGYTRPTLYRYLKSLRESGLLMSVRGGRFDVMVVDRMMPRLDGVAMVELLRKDGDQTPVLFLSALGEISHRVEGLKAGGDDYLVKPYAFAELIARVEALARRRETGSVHTLLRVGEQHLAGDRLEQRAGILLVGLHRNAFPAVVLRLAVNGRVAHVRSTETE